MLQIKCKNINFVIITSKGNKFKLKSKKGRENYTYKKVNMKRKSCSCFVNIVII